MGDTNKKAQSWDRATYHWDHGHLHARAEDRRECFVELARATAEGIEVVIETYLCDKTKIRRRDLQRAPAKPITSRVILLSQESTSMRPSLPSLLHSAAQASRSWVIWLVVTRLAISERTCLYRFLHEYLC